MDSWDCEPQDFYELKPWLIKLVKYQNTSWQSTSFSETYTFWWIKHLNIPQDLVRNSVCAIELYKRSDHAATQLLKRIAVDLPSYPLESFSIDVGNGNENATNKEFD